MCLGKQDSERIKHLGNRALNGHEGDGWLWEASEIQSIQVDCILQRCPCWISCSTLFTCSCTVSLSEQIPHHSLQIRVLVEKKKSRLWFSKKCLKQKTYICHFEVWSLKNILCSSSWGLPLVLHSLLHSLVPIDHEVPIAAGASGWRGPWLP